MTKETIVHSSTGIVEAAVGGLVGGGGGLFLLLLLLMLLLIFIIFIFACKPWRFFPRTTRSRTIKVDDIERPLVSEDLNVVQSQSTEFARNHAFEGEYAQSEGNFYSPRTQRRAYKQRLLPTPSQLTHSDSFILNIPDASEESYFGHTLKRPLVTHLEAQKYSKKEELSHDSRIEVDNDSFRQFLSKHTADPRSILTLEVISGPSQGARCSSQSTNKSRLPLTLGRVPPSDLLVKDSEVSGKHAMIKWNLDKLKWELVDMGSLNGTLVNSRAVNHADTGSRHWGDPIELGSGDIVTLGTTSQVSVQIKSQSEQVPFGVSVATDPMALRRGGKKLPMEDVCYYQWPLPGVDEFGLFGICDGHGGAAAAISASKIMPEVVTGILSDTFRREKVLSHCDASDVLREAFSQTEAHMNHFYEVSP